MAEAIRYVRDGYEEGAMRVVEYRDGTPVHVWSGYFNGGNHVRLYPRHPWQGVWDGRERAPMILSVWEIKSTI